MAYNRFLIGRILTARKDFDAASDLLEQALSDCWQQAMLDGRLIVHLALAELAWAQDDNEECERHLSQAEELADGEDVLRYRAECRLARAVVLASGNAPRISSQTVFSASSSSIACCAK